MDDCITVDLTHFCWHPVGLIRPRSDKRRKSADAGQIHNRRKAFTLGMSLFWNLSSICGLLFGDLSMDDVESGIIRFIRGATMTCQGCVSPPFSLIQNKTDDFSASFTHLRRKALQPFPQTFATFASNVCNLCLKRLQPLPQTFASFASNVCILCLKRLQVLANVPAKHCLFPRKRLPLLA